MSENSKIQLLPGFVIKVREAPDLSTALDIEVALQRPDMSVVQRRAHPVGGSRLELGLHVEDLALEGEYAGEVSCMLGGEKKVYSPAFTLRVSG